MTSCIVCKGTDFQTCVKRLVDYEYELDIPDLSFVECSECGLISLNPMPTVDELSTFYPKSYANYSAEKTSNKKNLATKLVEMYENSLFNFFSHFIKNGDRIFEVGAASGDFLALIHDRLPDCVCDGLEISDEAAKLAQSKGLGVKTGHVDSIEIKSDFYDLIVMKHVIEHLPDPIMAIKKLNKACKMGGVIYIETPDTDCLSRKIFGKFWGGYHSPRHTFLFSRQNINKILSGLGFQVYEANGTMHSFGWTLSIQNLLTDLVGIKKRGGRASFYGLLMAVFAPLTFLLKWADTSDAFYVMAKKTKDFN